MPNNDKQLSSLLFLAQRAVQRHARKGCCRTNSLSLLQLETLRFVKENKGLTMRELAAYLGITPPSTTSIIDELAKKGLIERQADQADRRMTRLFISQEGNRQMTDSFAEFVKRFDHSMRHLSAEEKAHLVALLLKITD